MIIFLSRMYLQGSELEIQNQYTQGIGLAISRSCGYMSLQKCHTKGQYLNLLAMKLL